jgi:hypothetical protein
MLKKCWPSFMPFRHGDHFCWEGSSSFKPTSTASNIAGLPPSAGKTTILVVVDRLSKSAHFLALAHPYIAKMVAEIFITGIVKLHGMPQSIVSDPILGSLWKTTTNDSSVP